MDNADKNPPRYCLGQSNTRLSPIGLGTWQFSQGQGMVGKFWPRLAPALIMSIVDEAINHGIDWFDTAEVYGGGRSEEALATALDDLNILADDVYIATKWWPVLRSARHLETSAQKRLMRLHQRPITLYQIHQPYSHSSIPRQMEAMARLIDEGLIRHAGVSNFSAQQMRQAYQALKAHGHTLVSNQVRYNLLDRRIETNGVMQAAADLGVSIIAYSPLGQGLLTGKFHDRHQLPEGFRRLSPHFRLAFLHKTRALIDALRQMAQAYEVTPSQVALNWIISQPGLTVFAIPGATRVSQAAQNAGAMAFRLSASDRQALDHLTSDFSR
ncbi:MAG: aldo/keto reductase [Sulfobacillus acidophilus]|uniref:Aldo/keto reductase n=1 Tax=Sulfobacillus acidophilus TaxID=53633 RepID=A0A2T2WM68_9FIRM|nr:MAG: aldo/keto reductase [Sulfobacillus acidophilus]